MSPTALANKLHIKPGHRVLVLNAPDDYLDLLGPLPDGATLVKSGGKDLDFVQVFVNDIAELERLAPRAIQAVKSDGLLWFCYPKKSSGAATDLSRDVGWDSVTGAGLEGVAQISIDDTWTGFRFRPVKR